MKIYLILNNNNVITGYSINKISGVPEIEIDDPKTIKLNVDTFDGTKIISNLVPQAKLKITRIFELKKLLAETDYQCLKHADGDLTDEEYADIKAQRHAWRQEINKLEGD